MHRVFIRARRREARFRVPGVIPITDPDAVDDTTADYERLESELVDHDQDAARVEKTVDGEAVVDSRFD